MKILMNGKDRCVPTSRVAASPSCSGVPGPRIRIRFSKGARGRRLHGVSRQVVEASAARESGSGFGGGGAEGGGGARLSRQERKRG